MADTVWTQETVTDSGTTTTTISPTTSWTGEVTGTALSGASLTIDNINLDGNTISATSGDLTLTAAGNDLLLGDSISVNTTISGDLTITGGNITNAITFDAGLIIPTGYDITLTDAPSSSTDAANKAYVDAQTHEAALTQEQVEDYAGVLVATGGTKTGITVTYQDETDDMDFVVDDATKLPLAGGTMTGHLQFHEDADLIVNSLTIDGETGDLDYGDDWTIHSDGELGIDADDAFNLQSDGAITINATGGTTIDKNTTATATATETALQIDYDHTGISASGQTITGIGLDLDMNCNSVTHVGTVSNTGIDIDMVAAADGTQNNTGIDISCTGADTNTHLKLSHDATNYCSLATIANGATTLATVDSDGTVAHLTLDVDGNITLDADGSDVFIKNDDSLGFQFRTITGTGSYLIINERGGTTVDDYCQIQVLEHGATTISTTDDAATAADLTLDIDGDIVLDPVDKISLSQEGDEYGYFAHTGSYTQLRLYENGGASTGDYFNIRVLAAGATNLLTIDAAGTDADFKVDADGDITLDAATGTITLLDNGSTYTPSASSDVANKGYVDTTMYDFRNANFYDNTISPTIFIPLADSIAELDSPGGGGGEYFAIIAPYNGILVQVQLRSESQIRDTVKVELVTATTDTEIPATSVGDLTHTYSDGSRWLDDTTDTWDFTGSLDTGTNAITKGDVVAIRVTMGADSGSYWYDTYCTVVFKWDATT